MEIVDRVIQTHPRSPQHIDALERRRDATHACAQACNLCADACLAEPTVAGLVDCIRINLDCADICIATGRILSRVAMPEPSFWRHSFEPASSPAGCAPTPAPATPTHTSIEGLVPRPVRPARKRAWNCASARSALTDAG